MVLGIIIPMARSPNKLMVRWNIGDDESGILC